MISLTDRSPSAQDSQRGVSTASTPSSGAFSSAKPSLGPTKAKLAAKAMPKKISVSTTEPDSELNTGARHQDAMQATADEVADVMVTNAFGPARAARTLLPALRDGGTLAVMSSLMGSISDSSGGYDLYRTSKVALNMLAKGVAEQHAAARGIAVLALHPGWVQTDMGGPQAKLTIDESVNGLADVLEGASGAGFRFVDYKGDELAF